MIRVDILSNIYSRLLFLYEQQGGRVFLFSDPSPHHEALARGIHELFIQALEEPWIAKTGTSPRLRDLQTLADLGSCQYSIKLPGGNIVKEPDAFFGRRGAPFKGVAVEIAFRNENEETLAREIVLWAQVPGISGFGVKINSRKGHPLERKSFTVQRQVTHLFIGSLDHSLHMHKRNQKADAIHS